MFGLMEDLKIPNRKFQPSKTTSYDYNSAVFYMITFMNKIQINLWVLMLAFGIQTYVCVGTASGSWSGRFVLAAAADAASSEKRVEKSGGSAPAAGTSEGREASEKELKPEKEKTPFKTFVPSERIEPDHAVDFPADI